MSLFRYLNGLSIAKQILWCYVIWYVCIVSTYFDNSPSLWLNSLGLSIIVGYALFLSTGPATLQRLKERFWESLRLFICPFLVSSFSALVKGKGFILLFSPLLSDNMLGLIACLSFLLLVQMSSLLYSRRRRLPS